MVLKDISLPSPSENILYDEVLLYLAEQEEQGEFLRFWESGDFFVVLGKTSDPVEDLYIERIEDDKIPVLRRASGGGTVLQGKGCLNYSLVLSKDRSPELPMIKKSYQYILGKITNALSSLGIKAQYHPISDMAIGEKKFSGNAQKRGKKFILHHGTLLYDFPLEGIERYLKIPKQIPEYRRGRVHTDFLANISAGAEELKRAIAKEFNAVEKEETVNPPERKALNSFLQTRNIVVDLKKMSKSALRVGT